VLGFLRADGRGRAATEQPASSLTVVSDESARSERGADPFPDLLFAHRVDDEKDAQTNLVIDPLGGGVVWS
jgi:hypothetical protein